MNKPKQITEQKYETAKTADNLKDRAGFSFQAHLKITDPATKKMLVNKRG